MRNIIERNGGFVVAANRRLCGSARLHAAGLAALGLMSWAALPGTQVFAGTFSTSPTAPTGALMSDPDNTLPSGSYTGYIDYSDNNAGVGQVFTPSVNMTVDAITFQGGGSAGGSLAGPWGFTFGKVAPYNNYWGGASTVIDYETGDGTPIATDVGNGITNNYDTFNLSSPVKLTAGSQYYFNFSTNGGAGYAGGYYLVAAGNANQSGGEAASLSSPNGATTPGSGSSLIWQRGYDRTYYLLGTTGTNALSQWVFNGSGNWETNGNWDNGAPSGAGDTATFATDNGTITVNPTVTLSTPVTLDSINFNASAVSYTINASGGSINLDTATGNQVNVLAGNHTINAPVVMDGSTTFTISPGSTLTLANVTGGGYGGVTVTGGGTLIENQLGTTGLNLTVNGATLTTLSATSAPQEIYFLNVYNSAVLNLNGILIANAGNFDPSATINLGASGQLLTQGTSTDYVNSTIAGPGSIGIGGGPNGGATTAYFNGTNSNFSGPVSVSNGSTLIVGADANLGNGSPANTVTLNNGTLATTAAFNGSHALAVTALGGTFNTGGFNIGLGSITVTGGGLLTISPQNPGGGVRAITLNSLNISAGTIALGTAALQSDKTVLVSSGLSLAGSIGVWASALDLGGNDLIVKSGTLATLSDQARQGYAAGTWQGSGGLLSAAAAADTLHLTALGVIQNSVNGSSSGATLYTSFDGVTSTSADVLVKYTYYGDANLDGKVDGSDYSKIDTGFLSQTTANKLTGWFNGDFNYDGVIDGSDYTLIDNTFNTQGAVLSAAVATAQITPGASAVPEPATLSVLAVVSLGLLGRKSRRRGL